VIQDNNIKTKILAEKMNENKNYFSDIPEISATNFVSIIIYKKIQPLADCPGYCLLQRWRTAPLPLLVPFAEDVVPVPASQAYLELTVIVWDAGQWEVQPNEETRCRCEFTQN